MSYIVYVDMDFTLCDYAKGFREFQQKYPDLNYPQSKPGMYISLEPIKDAIETFSWLLRQPMLDVYILTAPSLRNAHSYTEKRLWVERYLGFDAVKRLIISPNKGLNRGDFLIDDNIFGKGQEEFEGTILQFGGDQYPNWCSIRKYFERFLDEKSHEDRVKDDTKTSLSRSQLTLNQKSILASSLGIVLALAYYALKIVLDR